MCGVFLSTTKRRNRAWANILNNHTEDRFQKMRRRAFAYYGGNIGQLYKSFQIETFK